MRGCAPDSCSDAAISFYGAAHACRLDTAIASKTSHTDAALCTCLSGPGSEPSTGRHVTPEASARCLALPAGQPPNVSPQLASCMGRSSTQDMASGIHGGQHRRSGHTERTMLSSFELHHLAGPLLIQYAVAALAATDDVSGLDGVLGAAIAAQVSHPGRLLILRRRGVVHRMPVGAFAALLGNHEHSCGCIPSRKSFDRHDLSQADRRFLELQAKLDAH